MEEKSAFRQASGSKSGSHTELMKKGGFYAELYNSQFEVAYGWMHKSVQAWHADRKKAETLRKAIKTDRSVYDLTFIKKRQDKLIRFGQIRTNPVRLFTSKSIIKSL